MCPKQAAAGTMVRRACHRPACLQCMCQIGHKAPQPDTQDRPVRHQGNATVPCPGTLGSAEGCQAGEAHGGVTREGAPQPGAGPGRRRANGTRGQSRRPCKSNPHWWWCCRAGGRRAGSNLEGGPKRRMTTEVHQTYPRRALAKGTNNGQSTTHATTLPPGATRAAPPSLRRGSSGLGQSKGT